MRPHLAHVCPERRAGVIRDDAIHGAPDLVVEVLPHGTRDRDLGAQRALYARRGARQCRVVDPERRALVRFAAPAGGRYRVEEEAAEGELASAAVLVLRAGELFDPYAGASRRRQPPRTPSTCPNPGAPAVAAPGSGTPAGGCR